MRIDITKASAITGWMSARELRWLAEHAHRARTIVEIGSFQGRSTRALADHCQGLVYAVDPWNDYRNDDGSQADWIAKHGGTWSQIRATFDRNLADHLASGRVVPMPMASDEAAPMFLHLPFEQMPDLVFIDGDHRYEQVRADIELYQGLVYPGGILAGHDYGRRDWPGVSRAVDELLGPVGHCDSIWWVQL